MNPRLVVITVACLLFLLATPASAIVASARSFEIIEKRLVEIEASIGEIHSALTQSKFRGAQQKDLRELQKSLETEKNILQERKKLLERLEAQGLLMYANPPVAQPEVPSGESAARK